MKTKNEALKFKTETFLRMEQELNRLQVSNAALLAAAKRMKLATMKGFEGEPQDEKEIGLAWEQLTNAITKAEGKV